MYGEYHQVYCEYAADGARRRGLLVMVDLAFGASCMPSMWSRHHVDLDRAVADRYRDGGHVEQIPPAAAAV